MVTTLNNRQSLSISHHDSKTVHFKFSVNDMLVIRNILIKTISTSKLWKNFHPLKWSFAVENTTTVRQPKHNHKGLLLATCLKHDTQKTVSRKSCRSDIL